MPNLTRSFPKYRRHRASGQGLVTLNGKDFYLGQYESEDSRAEYDLLIGQWLANGRILPKHKPDNAPPEVETLTISELLLAYWKWAKVYYRKDDEATSEQNCIKAVAKLLKLKYGRTSAAEFGPLALQDLRDKMINAGRARTTINQNVGRIRRIFKWGGSRELIPASVYEALRTVDGLRPGRSGARETKPVKPVPRSAVDAIRLYVSPQIWAMVELQWLTGMRSGEVTIMRAYDIEMSGAVWLYRPTTHKTFHHGHERIVDLGPRSQKIIRLFLKADVTAYLFQPIDAINELHRIQCAQRVARGGIGSHKRRKYPPRWRPGDCYTADSYRRAIARVCYKAGIARWHPHQLRHAAATRIRKQYGLEIARAILGHRSLVVTETYAELDRQHVCGIVAKIG